MLFEQFLVEHAECWPGPPSQDKGELLSRIAKCSCGAQLESTILVKLVVDGHR